MVTIFTVRPLSPCARCPLAGGITTEGAPSAVVVTRGAGTPALQIERERGACRLLDGYVWPGSSVWTSHESTMRIDSDRVPVATPACAVPNAASSSPAVRVERMTLFMTLLLCCNGTRL